MDTIARAPTTAQGRLPLERRRAAFDVIFDEYALRYQRLRFVTDPDIRAERQRELAAQIARFRAQLWPESIPQQIGGTV